MNAIRDGLVALLGTVTGLRVSSSAPQQVNPPSAFLGTFTANYRASMGGDPIVTVSVWLVHSAVDSSRSADALDDWVDPAKPVITALNTAHLSWCDSLAVVAAEWPITIDMGERQYTAARIDLEVIA